MARPPFFAFYPADFASDINVEAMTAEQVGVYILLLCKAWQHDPPGTLPNDDERLARWGRITPARWQEIKAGVLAAFTLEQPGCVSNAQALPGQCASDAQGLLVQKRLVAEFARTTEQIRKSREKGQTAANARWNKARTGCVSNACALPEQSTSNAIQTQIKTQKEEGRPPTPAKPGVTVADGFQSRPATGEEEDPGKESAGLLSWFSFSIYHSALILSEVAARPFARMGQNGPNGWLNDREPCRHP